MRRIGTIARYQGWRGVFTARRRGFLIALLLVLAFNLYWYGAFLSFPLIGEDAAALYSDLLELIKDKHFATAGFPIEWFEGLGMPNFFVTFTFDPAAWLLLLPGKPDDLLRVSMALRATAAWLAGYWFVVVLFRGGRGVALASATFYLLIDFILTSAWGIPTYAGSYNATHGALFPLLPALALLIMRSPRRIGLPDLGLLLALLFFILDYPVGSLIGLPVFLTFAGAALLLARPAERSAARRGFAKIVALAALLLFGPPLYVFSSWSAVIQDSARTVFFDELFGYGTAYQPPFMWTHTPAALRLCLLIGLSVLLFNRRWPRPLRMTVATLLLVVGGVQLVEFARFLELDAGLVDRLPRLHYFEFYAPLFYATCGGFALRYWRDLVHPRLDDLRHVLSWAAGAILCVLAAFASLPTAAFFLAGYVVVVLAALLRGEAADAGRTGSGRLTRLLAPGALLGVVALAVGAWLPPTPDIHPIYFSNIRCQLGVLWCRDPVGPTMATGDNPIAQFLRRALGGDGAFAGRAETLVRPPAKVSLTKTGTIPWTPELFQRFHAWYVRAYDAQAIKDSSVANPLRLPPEHVIWFGPGDSRDYLVAGLAGFAHGDGSFYGPMQEDLVLEMQRWLEANGRKVGLAASDAVEGWSTASSVEALTDERVSAFFSTGNGLVMRALPYQGIPVASAYNQNLDYLYYLLWTRYASAGRAATKSINITSLEALHPERLALLGVRYLVARDSRVYAEPPLERVMGWHGYSVYALPDPNLAGYGVSGIEFGDTLARELKLMRAHGFRPRLTAVLPASERDWFQHSGAGELAMPASASIALAPNELIFSARLDHGRAFVVLPFNWSHCWEAAWRKGTGRLTRADVDLIGVAFEGEVELHLRWTAGYGAASRCLGEDRALVAGAKQAAAEVGFAEAYEPFDDRSPPSAVRRPSFARNFVEERALGKRGITEAVVPASAAALLSAGEREGHGWTAAVSTEFRPSAGGYEFSARNGGGPSLVVLPLPYSSCWVASWRGNPGTLLRVDERWLGVLFRQSVFLRLSRETGAAESSCARQDRIRQNVFDLIGDEPAKRVGAPYALGEPLAFGAGGNAEAFMGRGWSGPEAWGRWSVGPTAELILRVAPPASGDLVLDATLGALLVESRPSVRATVSVNGFDLAQWEFRGANEPSRRQAIVPRDLIAETGLMIVEFKVDRPMSPAQLGLSTDARPLALSFLGLTVKAADDR